MVDATKRKLKLPAWHIPYLEKHRILELYKEIVRELVIQQPVDHVLFMQQILINAYHATKVARVVILCAPRVNCIEVAKKMAEITGQIVITEQEILRVLAMEVFLGNGLIQDVVNKCIDLSNIRENYGGPLKPRVLILGPRGSGRKTQARLLESTMGLVHIDFEYILCQAWISDTDLGDRLRACRDDVCFRSDLLCEVVNKRLLELDCMEKGWVLTCFPFTVIDFKHLDTLDTPPNRVIFLEIDPNVCRERLTNRRVNAHTSSVTNIAEDPTSLWYKHLNTHPKDKVDMINAEIGYYCEQYADLRNYCGATATIINGDQPKRWVYESIAATIVRDSPAAPPRDPCGRLKQKSQPQEVQQSDSSSIVTQLFNSFINAEEKVTHEPSEKITFGESKIIAGQSKMIDGQIKGIIKGPNKHITPEK